MSKSATAKKPAKAIPAIDVTGAVPLPTLSTAPRSLPFGRLLSSPLNPRKHLDKSREALLPLAQSIGAKGVLENLLVRPLRPEDQNGDALYEIIAGERRWRAVTLAVAEGWLRGDYEVPVSIISPCSDAELVELAATENFAREDMSPLDEADAIAALREYHPDAEIMRRLGIPERTFYRRVALLRLAPELQQALRDGAISNAQAAAFARGDIKAQRAHYKAMVAQPTYEGRIDRIESTMLRRRIPVGKQIFDLADYKGEIVADPEDGKQYFADTGAFKKLQDKVLDAKVEALETKWPWAKRIVETRTYDYVDAKKENKKAGAIVYLDYNGKLKVKAPVVPRPAQRAAGGGRSAEPQESYEDRQARIAALRRPYRDALVDNGHATLAAWLACRLEDGRIEAEHSPFLVRALEPLRERLAPALGFAVTPEMTDLLEALQEDGHTATLYRALAIVPLDQLLALFAPFAARAIENEIVDWAGDVSPLAAAIGETLNIAPAAAPAEVAQ